MKAIMFDLDGTLLPMDQDEFTRIYFKELAVKALPWGYESEKLIKTIWKGIDAMVKNDGVRSNEEVFWKLFSSVYGENALKDRPLFDEFYRVEFAISRKACGYNPMAKEAVQLAKSLGFVVALATNPVFPAVATESRMGWAGFSPSDFVLYTTYENSCTCKPDPAYYREVAGKLGIPAEECLMVGNDALEDMAAEQTGMKVFLLTDCLINREKKDISVYPNGGFAELMEYIRNEAK